MAVFTSENDGAEVIVEVEEGLPPGADLLDLGGLYILYPVDDHAYHHMTQNTTAKPIRLSDISPRGTGRHDDLDAVWGAQMHHPLFRVALHMWRQGLDFTCLDIGAHLGAFSIPFGSFARDCGKRVPIYAFEPSPEIFPLLKRSIQINQVDDVCTSVNAAVSDATRPVEFIVFDQLSTVSSGLEAAVLHFGNRPNRRVAVEGVSIDDFVKEKAITSHLVCKIDTEGWDLKVVDGMRHCIEDRLVVMQMEFTPGLLESYTDPIERLESLSLDYVLMEVVLESDLAETGVRRIGTKRSDLEAFVERAKATPFRCEDVLALPKSMHALPELVERLHEDRAKQMEHRAKQMEHRARRSEERAKQLEEERSSLENQLARFMMSRSWQITRPLRVGRGWMRQHISPHLRYFRHQESA